MKREFFKPLVGAFVATPDGEGIVEWVKDFEDVPKAKKPIFLAHLRSKLGSSYEASYFVVGVRFGADRVVEYEAWEVEDVERPDKVVPWRRMDAGFDE